MTGSLDLGLAGLRAVVTGSTMGIGRAIAEQLATAGVDVYGLDIEADRGDTTFTQLQADLCDQASVSRAFRDVADRAGGLDLLVNNAGVAFVGGVEAGSDDDWMRLLDLNLLGYRRAIVAALPMLRASSSASIINISSCSATSGIPQRAAYSASKGAVHSLTLSLAADLVAEGIRVNGITPGTVHTPFMDRLIAQAPDPNLQREAFEARQPTGAMVDPAEIGRAVCLLASPLCPSITGSFIVVDGGLASLRPLKQTAAPKAAQ